MKRVLLVDPIAAAGEDYLARHAEVLRAPDSDPETIRRLAAGVDGIVIRSKLPDDIFEAAPRVRAVAIHGTGTDLVPLDSATARGVMVSNIPGGNARSVAEYCAMAMLMLARAIFPIVDYLKAKTWDTARALGADTREIGGLTLGVVGVGAIGTRLARIARNGFGMRVLGTQRRLDRLPAEAPGCALDDLLVSSDFVVVTCPLTPQTRHLMNQRTLALMKPSAWLVNVGRGAVVEEAALIAVLRERRIAGAMLDVYEHYRLEPGNELLALANVILTPHLAGMTRESRARMSVAAAEDMVRMLSGEPPRNLVNPQAANVAHH
jgi:D-3-phosphoglycerate dehydrogenase / 2-oxoglutarate reductase